MSRIGVRPIPIPAGVEVSLDGEAVRVKGPKGSLERTVRGPVTVKVDEAARQVIVDRTRDDRRGRSHHGLWRALVANMVSGVTEGVSKTLEIIGVGYRAEVQGKTLKLGLGFAVPRELPIPEGVSVEVGRPTRPGIDGEIRVSGIDKEKVGQFAADIRAQRPPDVYKGKGIRYRGEYVRKLAGKTFGSAAT
jgi:large subunit ribosomal protein L6